MAQGNWKPEVINPRPRCRFCMRALNKRDIVYRGGINPAHKECCEDRGEAYTLEFTLPNKDL